MMKKAMKMSETVRWNALYGMICAVLSQIAALRMSSVSHLPKAQLRFKLRQGHQRTLWSCCKPSNFGVRRSTLANTYR